MKKTITTEKTVIYFIETGHGREAHWRIITHHADNLQEVYEKIYDNVGGNNLNGEKKKSWEKYWQRVQEISIVDGNIEGYKTVFLHKDGVERSMYTGEKENVDLINYKEYERGIDEEV